MRRGCGPSSKRGTGRLRCNDRATGPRMQAWDRGGDGGAAMAGALAGVRVVEFGRWVAAPYCARLLADLGADCLKLERPGGDPARYFGPFPRGRADPERGGLFAYLN